MQKQLHYLVTSAVLAGTWFAIAFLVLFLTNSCYFSGEGYNPPNSLCIAAALPLQLNTYVNIQMAYAGTILIVYFLLNTVSIILHARKRIIPVSQIPNEIAASKTEFISERALGKVMKFGGIIAAVIFLFFALLIGGIFIIIGSGKYVYPDLKTIQKDPVVSLRMPNAVEFQHYSRDRESGIDGASPPSIFYAFGSHTSKEQIVAFYDTNLIKMEWIPKGNNSISLTAKRSWSWCKSGLNFWLGFPDSFEIKTSPILKQESDNYTTLFETTLSGRSKDSECPQTSK